MLRLPRVTLICLTGQKFPSHDNAIKRSCEKIEFGAVKVIYDYKIKNINDWNYKVIYDLWKYVDTEFALLIHPDGFVVNPESWRDEWYQYDYIGAPWPLPKDDYSYRDKFGEIQRVGNSVSLRSQNILYMPTMLDLGWKSYYGNTNEDGFLCVHNRKTLEQHGITFAPLEVAKYFSRELDIPENKDVDKPFAFHLADGFPGRNKEYEKLIK